MSNYVKATNFYAKDALLSGNPDKIIKGAEIDDEFNAIATAIATKANLNSPNLTGTPTVPTAPSSTSTTQAASTAYVKSLLGTIAIQDSDDVAITGGSIVDITDLLVVDGGTGSSTLEENAVLLGNGEDPLQVVAPGDEGNLLTSDGTTWVSSPPPDAGIGVGQTWQNVTGSRSANTTYTNSTGKPIQVMITTYKVGSSAPTTFYVDSVSIGYTDSVGTNDVGNWTTTSFIVPNESTYQAAGDFQQWAELR